MKPIFKILSAVLALALGGCAAPARGEADVRLFAVNVGKGDALLLCVDGWTALIDAGKARSRGRVLSAMARMGVDRLDAVFVTHTDDDHTGGLEWLADSDIPVGAWYASGYYTGVKSEDKHPAVKAAARRGESVVWLTRGDGVALGDTGATLRVLAPAARFPDDEDDNSLVMMLETDQGRMLFTGDMELPGEAELLSHGDDLSCAVLKVPNHGDDDATGAELARAAGAAAAVISTDGAEKPGTPDPGVLGRLAAAGSACYVTQDAELGLLVTLHGGVPTVTAQDVDAPLAEGVALRSVVSGDDLITLDNRGGDLDMTGWYLHSDRGDELFAFPDGFVLPAGGSVIVGSRSSDAGSYDLLWDDKKVVHKSKTDVLTLYDAWGRCVDSRANDA